MRAPEEIMEKHKNDPFAAKKGILKLSVEKIEDIRHSWRVEGMTKGQITKVYELGMNIVEEIVNGIPQGRVDVRNTLHGMIPKKPKDTKETDKQNELPDTTPISLHLQGQLYMLTLSAGFSNINEFLANELLPVYGIKLRWEVKLQRRITPKELSEFIEVAASKAVRFDEAVKGMMSPG